MIFKCFSLTLLKSIRLTSYPMAVFRSIKELTSALQQGSKLLNSMFLQRRTFAVKYEDALETLDGDENKLRLLISHGIIDQTGDNLELEEIYQNFFEVVLAVNEEINIETVKQYIDTLRQNIRYYFEAENNPRRDSFIKKIRHTFRSIGSATLRNVMDLKRNVDDTYKQEPNFKIKELRLKDYDEKTEHIRGLITETERLIAQEAIFFASASDYNLRQTVNAVRSRLAEADHGLIAIKAQIIDYLNRIEYQSKVVKRVRHLKYLRDKFMIEQASDVRRVVAAVNDVWMEPQAKFTTKVSLDFLLNDDAALPILDNIRARLNRKATIRSRLAGKIDPSYLQGQTETARVFNHQEVLNGFLAQKDDLFSYLWNYPFSETVDRELRLVLFLQMASQWPEKMAFTSEFNSIDNIEYPIIYPQ